MASPATAVLRAQNGQQAMFSHAEAYERFMGRWSRRIAPLLARFAAIPETGRVLDIGSGTGALAFEIARQRTRVQVTGVDPSSEYVAFATRQNRSPERIAFQEGDAQRMDFPDQTFVASISLLVFNFIPDAARALQEARRVTRPKRGISAAVWDYGDRMVMLRAFWDAAAEIDPQAEKLDEKHMPLCRSGELSQLWKQGGLTNIQDKPLETEIRFASFSDYWEPFLLGQGPAGAWVRTLPENRVQALQRAVKRRLNLGSTDKSFALPARVWAVRGEVPAR
jgi:ubiquinone/menaquinone biosynthesis C-methylase UbiE